MTVSRRRVLAALAATGGVSGFVWTASGSGTTAVLGDDEKFEAALTAGTVDLTIEYEILAGPGADTAERYGIADGPRVRIPIETLGANGMSGRALFTFSLPQRGQAVNNPAALWLATDCPAPAATDLGEALQLDLSYADCETGARLDPIASGSLREVATALRGGRQIDGDPTTRGVDCLTDRVCLLAEYELVDYIGSETVDLPLWASATQCRHTTPTNPFAGIDTGPCLPAEDCTCCQTLGKLELENGSQPGIGNSQIEPGIYAFTEGNSEYELDVYQTVDKDDSAETVGVGFRLKNRPDRNGAVPELCTVWLKGGPGAKSYNRGDSARTDTVGLTGSDADGIVYAPDGTAISHILVCICTNDPEADCSGCSDPSLTPGSNGNGRGSKDRGDNSGNPGKSKSSGKPDDPDMRGRSGSPTAPSGGDQ
ncbi:hypothetical protein ABNG03_10740 [Halorubrum sp. RMP-47]|uniref:hypothetical protein n=1 Tax=Halorubrum miltondacostae TaxID=3076378 RepID=UPI003527FD24